MHRLISAVARHLIHVGMTVFAVLGLNWINEILFIRLAVDNGINWIFLPAGVRLLSTLFFGLAGLEGMFVVSVYLNFSHFTFDSDYRSWSGAVAGSLGPYLASLFAIHWFNLRSRLEQLTNQRLLFTGMLCGLLSPIFHHTFMWVLTGNVDWTALTAMIVGDTSGILIVLYLTRSTVILAQRFGPSERLAWCRPLARAVAAHVLPADWRRRSLSRLK